MSPGDHTVVDPLPLTVQRADVLHFLEYPDDHEPPERIARLLDESLVEARQLVSARGCYRGLPVERAQDIDLAPIDAEGLVLGLVTVGGALEARVTELSQRGEMTRAVILDAAGSAAAEEAADQLGGRIAGARPKPTGESSRASLRGEDRIASLPCRLSPGYGRWDVTAQRRVFPLLLHDAVGVTLLPSCLMVPQKSISFAMWLGARGKIAQGLAGCSRCSLAHCRYRRSPAAPQTTADAPRL